MKTIEISQKLRKAMEEELKADRFDHTLGVAYTASSMAMVHGADVQKALIAGMLHDCAKCMSHDKQYEICKDNNIEVSEVERRNKGLLHAKVGSFLAADKYKIEDKEILDAIRYHTTGRPGMTLLEKIVFIADFIEPNRKDLPEMDEIRREAFEDIDKCLKHILKNTLIYLESSDKECDPMTRTTYEYYMEEK
ncbi:MAG: bis(5'-nucleosyl)-tetraphosphatase (symmetrical) YqeK [Butyrivibrio sp.]|nr:bis(5'-nucleosyl)-tetraphosphatase (symmetrical) YqeK [Butyrivibrio sp.]